MYKFKICVKCIIYLERGERANFIKKNLYNKDITIIKKNKKNYKINIK